MWATAAVLPVQRPGTLFETIGFVVWPYFNKTSMAAEEWENRVPDRRAKRIREAG